MKKGKNKRNVINPPKVNKGKDKGPKKEEQPFERKGTHKVEERKEPHKMEERNEHPKIEDKKELPKFPKIEEKSESPKVEEKRVSPKVEEKREAPIIEEKRESPKVEEKRVTPKVEEKREAPIIEEKRESPKVEEKRDLTQNEEASIQSEKPLSENTGISDSTISLKESITDSPLEFKKEDMKNVKIKMDFRKCSEILENKELNFKEKDQSRAVITLDVTMGEEKYNWSVYRDVKQIKKFFKNLKKQINKDNNFDDLNDKQKEYFDLVPGMLDEIQGIFDKNLRLEKERKERDEKEENALDETKLTEDRELDEKKISGYTTLISQMLEDFFTKKEASRTTVFTEFLNISNFSFNTINGTKPFEGFAEKKADPRLARRIFGCICPCLEYLFCKQYNQRWIILKDDMIDYADTSRVDVEKGVYYFDKDFKIFDSPNDSKIIGLQDASRILYLKFNSEFEKLLWKQEINKRMEKQVELLKNNKYEAFATPKRKNEVKWFSDGEAYFADLYESLMKAENSVLITDWWLSPEVYLKRPVNQLSFEQLKRDKKNHPDDLTQNLTRLKDVIYYLASVKNVKIYVMVYCEKEIALTLNSKHSKQSLKDHENIEIIRHPKNLGALLWSHHEKLCIIDQNVGYVGGLDLCWGRFDTHDHPIVEMSNADKNYYFPGIDYSNARINDFVEVENYLKESVSRDKPRMPWHDVHIRIEGPAVPDIARHFSQRWNDVQFEKRGEALADIKSNQEQTATGDVKLGGKHPHPKAQKKEFEDTWLASILAQSGVELNENPEKQEPMGEKEPQESSGFNLFTNWGKKKTSEVDKKEGFNFGGLFNFGKKEQPPQFEQSSIELGQTEEIEKESEKSTSQDKPHGKSGEPHGKSGEPHGPHGKSGEPHGPHGKSEEPHGPHGKSEEPHGPHGKSEEPHGPHAKGLGGLFAPHGKKEEKPKGGIFGFSLGGLIKDAGKKMKKIKIKKKKKVKKTKAKGMDLFKAGFFGFGKGKDSKKEAMTANQNDEDEEEEIEIEEEVEVPEEEEEEEEIITKKEENKEEEDKKEEEAKKVEIPSYLKNEVMLFTKLLGNRIFIDEDHAFKRREEPQPEQQKPTFYNKMVKGLGNSAKSAKKTWFRDHREMSSVILNKYMKKRNTNKANAVVQVLRSSAKWSAGLNKTEHSILNGYYKLIDEAQHYIYIENQFFVSRSWDEEADCAKKKDLPRVVQNQIAFHIRKRIEKAILNNENFKVVVFIPLLPGFAGEPEDSGTLQLIMKHTYAGIAHNHGYSIIEKIRDLLKTQNRNPDEVFNYINFYSLRNHGVIKDTPVTEIIYIHSKLMIVDDTKLLIGSANINDRSMLGFRDSEFAVIVEDEVPLRSTMDGKPYKAANFAATFRRALYAEHIGLKDDDPRLNDPLGKEINDLLNGRAQKNTEIYNKVFKCYPDDEFTSFAKLKKVKRPKGDELKQLYNENIKDIQGHVVKFPIGFLEDEVDKLGLSFFSAEGLLPEYNYT